MFGFIWSNKSSDLSRLELSLCDSGNFFFVLYWIYPWSSSEYDSSSSIISFISHKKSFLFQWKSWHVPFSWLDYLQCSSINPSRCSTSFWLIYLFYLFINLCSIWFFNALSSLNSFQHWFQFSIGNILRQYSRFLSLFRYHCHQYLCLHFIRTRPTNSPKYHSRLLWLFNNCLNIDLRTKYHWKTPIYLSLFYPNDFPSANSVHYIRGCILFALFTIILITFSINNIYPRTKLHRSLGIQSCTWLPLDILTRVSPVIFFSSLCLDEIWFITYRIVWINLQCRLDSLNNN